MECLVENIPVNSVLAFIGWNRNGGSIAPVGVHIVIDTQNESTIESVLRINNIEVDEAGIYECVTRFIMPGAEFEVELRGSVTINVEGEFSV